MTFAEKLKDLRKQEKLSQESLADKLGVSRQAVTKWEMEAGIPDIENLISISKLFGVSLDELMGNQSSASAPADYRYESVTEYDIDEPKHYDIKLGGAKRVILTGYEGEKVKVRLVSNTLSELQGVFKVKIDDIKKRIDIDVNRKSGVTEAAAKEAMEIFIYLPVRYIGNIELSAAAEKIELNSFECESTELDIKASSVVLDGIQGKVEINCNLDMEIFCRTLNGAVEVNQLSASSKIYIPKGTEFYAEAKGKKTSISYEINGKAAEDFSSQKADNYIELNGMKSELVIAYQ